MLRFPFRTAAAVAIALAIGANATASALAAEPSVPPARAPAQAAPPTGLAGQLPDDARLAPVPEAQAASPAGLAPAAAQPSPPVSPTVTPQAAPALGRPAQGPPGPVAGSPSAQPSPGASTAQPLAPSLTFDIEQAEIEFFGLLNEARVARGLDPLHMDPRLMEVARWRSDDMVARNYFSHDIGGFTTARVLRSHAIRFVLAGENITVNTFEAAHTVAIAQADLMSSPTHRANVLRPEFNLVGVGIAVAPNRKTVYTQVFIQTPEFHPGPHRPDAPAD